METKNKEMNFAIWEALGLYSYGHIQLMPNTKMLYRGTSEEVRNEFKSKYEIYNLIKYKNENRF